MEDRRYFTTGVSGIEALGRDALTSGMYTIGRGEKSNIIWNQRCGRHNKSRLVIRKCDGIENGGIIQCAKAFRLCHLVWRGSMSKLLETLQLSIFRHDRQRTRTRPTSHTNQNPCCSCKSHRVSGSIVALIKATNPCM